jgi:hypothetical protein
LGLLGILLVPALSVCQDVKAILASDYEYKMISSGNNFPGVNLNRDHLGDICILLHEHMSPEETGRYFGRSVDELQAPNLRWRSAKPNPFPETLFRALPANN